MARYLAKHRSGHPIGGTTTIAAAIAIVVLAAAAVFVASSFRGGTASPRAGAAIGDPAAAAGARGGRAGPPAGPAVRTFDIVATGDILPHPSIARTALADGNGTYDFRSMFAPLRPLISRAALAICHVEVPLTGRPPTMDPTFTAPTQVASAIGWTGFDVCSTASNHTLDQHQDGIDSTLAALDAAGVEHAGSYSSAQEATRIPILDADGVRVAFLAYTYGTNGIPPPSPWSVNLMSFDHIEADADRARAAGADLVIVNLHWGTQYVNEPDAGQTTLANRLLSQHVVDAIVGEHAHVVQPIRRIAGGFVSFGQGNLLASQYPFGGYPIGTLDGIVTVIHVRAAGAHATITGVDYVPTFIERPSFRILPVGAELQRLIAEGKGDGLLAQELRASYARTVAAVGTGPLTHPVPPRLP